MRSKDVCDHIVSSNRLRLIAVIQPTRNFCAPGFESDIRRQLHFRQASLSARSEGFSHTVQPECLLHLTIRLGLCPIGGFMTRTMTVFLMAVALVLASSVTVPAQGKRGSTPKPQVSSKGTTTKVSSPKTTQAGPKTTSAGSKTSKGGPKTTTAKATGKTKTTSPATRTAKADAKTTAKSAKADTKA